MLNLDRILLQSLQRRDNAYPQIDTIDKHNKTATVNLGGNQTEIWSIHIVLPEDFEQCINDDLGGQYYVCKIAPTEQQIFEARNQEALSKATSLTDAQIVEVLEGVKGVSLEKETESICKWYRDNKFLTARQRRCLNVTYLNLLLRQD